MINPNGVEEYWQHGERHRDNGPAVIWEYEKIEHHLHGQFHRDNAPAIIYPNGIGNYWENDILITAKI